MTALDVLVVTARFSPDNGGIETHVEEVCRRLGADDRFHLTVVATDVTGQRARTEEWDGFTLERVRGYPRKRDFYVAPGLWRRVTKGPERLVHLQGVHTAVPVLGALASLRAKKPFLVTLHTGGHSSPTRHGLRGLQWRALGPLLRRADAVIGVSEHEAALFQRLAGVHPERMHVIRNGGALPTLPADAVPADPTAPVLLSLGRLEKYKGHHRLIEALPLVLKSHPEARVVILGKGPYEQELRDLAVRLGVQDRVEITFVEGGDRLVMARRLHGASVVCLLSDYEAHPVAVMEAATLHRPVLVLRTSGLTELVTAGIASGIDPDPTTEQVAAALVDQLENPVLPPADFALPTWDQCARALGDVYLHVSTAR